MRGISSAAPMVLLAAGLVVASGLLWLGEEFFLLTSQETMATVASVQGETVSCRRSGSRRSCTEFTAVLDFRDAGGVPFRLSTSAGSTSGSEVSTSHASLSVGDEVAVVYNPDDPNEVVRKRWWELHRWSTIALAFASVLGVAGVMPSSRRRLRL